MRQEWILAWRNLWRNKRRTIITLASIVASVAFCTIMRSVQVGVFSYLTSSSVRNTTGFLQIHAHGFWDDKSINNTFESTDSLWRLIQSDNNITLAVPRLECFALASSGLHTKGIAVIGIDPIKEDTLTKLGRRVIHGSYFSSANDTGIVIGEGLAEYLHVVVGDSIVLLGQGFHGATAAAQCRVQGIFHFPIEEFNASLAYLALPKAQALNVAPNRLTSISIMLADERSLAEVHQRLGAALDSTWEIMDWPEMNKALVQMVEGKTTQAMFVQGILYTVVGFGMFGTILMMTMERRKEFAVMMAVGMSKTKVIRGLVIETLLIGGLGALIGLGLVYPMLAYINANPIHIGGTYGDLMQQFGFEPLLITSIIPTLFINQGIVVFALSLGSAIYPFWHVGRFKIMESLKW